jgi:hypothetical protein
MLHEYVQTFYFTARKNFRWKLNTPLKVSTLHCKVQAAGLWSAPSIIALCWGLILFAWADNLG